MQLNKYILILLAVLFVGCAVKQTVIATPEPEPEPEPEVPTWHTCVIQGAKATVTTPDEKVSATVTMQAVHDSLIIVSIMPALGIEMARIEATPDEVLAFDKFHSKYAQATYEELNHRLIPPITWKQLQQICSAELPTGDEKARLVYALGKQTITVEITYTPRKVDVPVRMTRLQTNKYKKMDISKWL